MSVIKIFAAGSLRGYLKDFSRIVKTDHGFDLIYELGPSGVLKERIVNGESPDLFLSANLRYPMELVKDNFSTGVIPFSCNELCLFGNFLNRHHHRTAMDWMFDPAVRLGTSTPGDDPGGDYAFEVFKKVERIRPGSYEKLSARAHVLVGGRKSVPPPQGVHPVLNLFQNNKIDLFLGYYTSARDIQNQLPGIEIMRLPANIAMKTRYAFTRLAHTDSVIACAKQIRSDASQSILADHGFNPI